VECSREPTIDIVAPRSFLNPDSTPPMPPLHCTINIGPLRQAADIQAGSRCPQGPAGPEREGPSQSHHCCPTAQGRQGTRCRCIILYVMISIDVNIYRFYRISHHIKRPGTFLPCLLILQCNISSPYTGSLPSLRS
jgi:hypothetical protein